MADNGATDPDKVQWELEDRLMGVGKRLRVPPDEVQDLLQLLKEVEECLLKVEQSPPESTLCAFRPVAVALVKKELVGHSDPNVKLALASCISEITRITAPDAPYDDDAMRDIFTLIVGTFQHLGDIESPSFGKIVSILDTVAKVRSYVVMLDLECDDLIIDMFHHFLRTVSSRHSYSVKSCMETIMRLVIEESEDVQPQIASCLLQNVKGVPSAVGSHTVRGLGKGYLRTTLPTQSAEAGARTLDLPVTDGKTLPLHQDRPSLQNVRNEEKESSLPSFELAERVIESCREKLKPVFLQSLKGTSLSEYSQFVALVCEEGSDDRDDNNADPSGKDVVDDGKPSERTISDELPEELSKAEQDVSRPEQDGSSKNVITGTAISSDAAPADTGESNQVLPCTKGKLGQPCYTENIVDADKLNSGHHEGTKSIAAAPKNKSAVDADKSIELNPSDKSEATAHSGADTKKHSVASGEETDGTAADTSKNADITPVKPRRGRPPGPKSLEKKAAGKNKPSSLDSAGKLTKRSAKDEVQPSVKKAGEGESSKKPQKRSLKHQKDDTLSEEDPAKDLSLKEMISAKSLTKRLGRPKGPSTGNSASKREQEQETEELPRSRKNKGLDGRLVGARIKVWWPDDKMFYNGVVESFDSGSKRHKVAYDDGDVEVLLLRDEKWEFISEDKGALVASETPRGRKRKGEAVKEENTETPKSDAVDPPKKRGRPKGWRPSNGTPNSSATSAKGKAASKDVKETPKTSSNLKNEVEKSSKDKAGGSTVKTKDESNEGKGRPGRKQKNATAPAVIDADKDKLKEKESKTAEIEQEATANASAGRKRRRKA